MGGGCNLTRSGTKFFTGCTLVLKIEIKASNCGHLTGSQRKFGIGGHWPPSKIKGLPKTLKHFAPDAMLRSEIFTKNAYIGLYMLYMYQWIRILFNLLTLPVD